MKALITGGAGFLGSNLTADLLSKGYEIVVVDNFTTGSKEHIAEFEGLPNFTLFEMSIQDPRYAETFNGPKRWGFDEIYHLACPTGVPNISTLGEEMMEASSAGTKNVLHTALKDKAKLVFTSSSEVYGDPLVTPQSEDYTGNVDPQGPRANYEEAKRFSEALVQLYVQKYGADARTLRLFNVYGPKMNFIDQRVVPVFVQAALEGRPLPVHDHGEHKRTMCYVSDLVDGLQLVIKKGPTGEIYNIGSDESMTIGELAQKIIDRTGSKSVIEFTNGFDHDHKQRMPDLRKVYALGWKRKVGLDEGLQKTIEYFKKRAAKR